MSSEIDIITFGTEFLAPGDNTVSTFYLDQFGIDNHHWVKACAFPKESGQVQIVFENYVVDEQGKAQYIVEFKNPGPNTVAFDPQLLVAPNR